MVRKAVIPVVLLVLILISTVFVMTNDDDITLQPQGFSLLYPTDGSMNVSLRPTLQWEDSINAQSFSLYITDNVDIDLSAPVVDNAPWNTSYTLTVDLNGSTQYFWRVVAHNDNEQTVCDDDISFSTVPLQPASFSLISPSSVGNSLEKYYMFEWEESYGADNYTLLFSTDDGFNETYLQFTGLIQNKLEMNNVIQALPIRNTFYWKVIAHNSGGDTHSNVYNITRLPEEISTNMNRIMPIQYNFDDLEIFPFGVGDGRIPLMSDDGTVNNIRTSIGPWGTHYPPTTGDFDGRLDSNWIGEYNASLMVDLGELNSSYDNISGISIGEIKNKTSSYVAVPGGLNISQIMYADSYIGETQYYSNTEWHLIIDAYGYVDGHELYWHIGHLAYLNDELIACIAAALGNTTENTTDMILAYLADKENVGGDILEHLGIDYLIVAEGTKMAIPHTFGVKVATIDGVDYYAEEIRGENYGDPPAGYLPPGVQIEFTLVAMNHSEYHVSQSYFLWIPQHEQDAIQSMIDNWALNHENNTAHNRDWMFNEGRDWLWGSELELYSRDWTYHPDASSITTGLYGLGFWGEYDGVWDGELPSRVFNDDCFMISPVYWGDALTHLNQGNAFNFYENVSNGISAEDVHYTVLKARAQDGGGGPGSYDRFGQVIQHEGIETRNGSMLIYWHPTYDGFGTHVYQSMNFVLIPDQRYLLIAWSDEYDTYDEAVMNMPAAPSMNDVDGGVYDDTKWDKWNGPGVMRYHNLFDLSRFGPYYYNKPLHV